MTDEEMKQQAFNNAHPDGDFYDENEKFSRDCTLCTKELRKLQEEEIYKRQHNAR